MFLRVKCSHKIFEALILVFELVPRTKKGREIGKTKVIE